MSKEVTARSAMKLALEALNAATRDGAGGFEDAKDALREELAKPDFWEGYVPEPDNTCSNALRAQGKAYPRTCKKCGLGPCVGLAQQALDKKAENARELGLDYEPVWGGGPTNKDYEDAMRQRRLHQLTSPPTLSLAQRQARSADTWVGLTDEDRAQCVQATVNSGDAAQLIAAIEAKLKEKNT